jgi:hypothetical protein
LGFFFQGLLEKNLKKVSQSKDFWGLPGMHSSISESKELHSRAYSCIVICVSPSGFFHFALKDD